jgi:hypothetical protein
MVKLSGTAKKMMMVVAVLVGVFILASALYDRSFGFLPFAAGALLGGGLNIVKIVLLDRIVAKTVAQDVTVTTRSFYAQYFLRLFLTIGALVLAVFVPFISPWGAAAGVISFPLAAHAMRFFPHQD